MKSSTTTCLQYLLPLSRIHLTLRRARLIPGMSAMGDQEEPWEATQLQALTQSQTQSQGQGQTSSQAQPWVRYWAMCLPMMPTLELIKVPWGVTVWKIGRRAEGNDTVISEKRVSGHHCEIRLDGQTEQGDPIVWLYDNGSSNGTFVNAHRITKGTRRMLVHGDEISLGSAEILGGPDVRWIFRAVGRPGKPAEPIGGVYTDYQFLKTLGTGTFAEVKQAINVETGEVVAIKVIKKHRFAASPKTLALFQREIEILASLRHPYICSYITHYEDPGHIYVVLEYVDGGDMLGYINNYKILRNGHFEDSSLPESHAAELSLMLCQAMAYIHDRNVTHRDLKPENILLTKEDNQGRRLIKVADFGLAKMVDSGTFLKSMVGTPQYLAPEIVMQTDTAQGYDNVVDSWSVGIVVYTMLSKMLPFEDEDGLPMAEQIKSRLRQNPDMASLRSLGISENAIDFISKMLEKDPYRRMTMAEALEHPWLSGRELDDTGASSPGDVSNFSSINSNMSKDTIMGLSGGAATGLRTPALPSEHQDEDFSQPLRDLRLNTPHMRFQLPHNDSSFYAGPESDLDHSPDAKIHSAIHIPSQAIPPTVGALNSPNLKRKLTAVTVGAPIAEFSSGELSPAPSPPPSASPGPHTASASHSPITSYTPDAPSDSSAMGEPLAKAKRRIKRISDATKTPVRVSPRLNAKKQTNDESSPSTARARRTKR